MSTQCERTNGGRGIKIKHLTTTKHNTDCRAGKTKKKGIAVNFLIYHEISFSSVSGGLLFSHSFPFSWTLSHGDEIVTHTKKHTQQLALILLAQNILYTCNIRELKVAVRLIFMLVILRFNGALNIHRS